MMVDKPYIQLLLHSNISELNMKCIDSAKLIYMVCLKDIHISFDKNHIQKSMDKKDKLFFDCPKSLVDCIQHILIRSKMYLLDKRILLLRVQKQIQEGSFCKFLKQYQE